MALDSCDHDNYIVVFDRSIYSNNCPVCDLIQEKEENEMALQEELVLTKAQLEQVQWEYENHPKEIEPKN